MSMSEQDREALRQAKLLLEQPSFAVRVTDLVGLPLEKALERG
ncbi:MAG TPA: hypothetical protein VF331_23495 [Polyangiales bacterium]